MENIDKPDVTIVANNGGTNMQFSLANIKKAIIIIVPENKMNFEYILDGKADVFFTDRIEAMYKEKTNPELIAVNPDHPHDSAEMVYLIPITNKKLQSKVNTWLKQVKENGSYNQFLEKALDTKY